MLHTHNSKLQTKQKKITFASKSKPYFLVIIVAATPRNVFVIEAIRYWFRFSIVPSIAGISGFLGMNLSALSYKPVEGERV